MLPLQPMILHATLLVTFPQKLSLSPMRQLKKTRLFQSHSHLTAT
jgi:hypothetical protein